MIPKLASMMMNAAARIDETTENTWKPLICPWEAPSSPLIWMMLSGMLSNAISQALVPAYITDGVNIMLAPSAPVHVPKPSRSGEKPKSASPVRTPRSRSDFVCETSGGVRWRAKMLQQYSL